MGACCRAGLQKTGSDRDAYGCIASAGYTWSQVAGDCLRLWEAGVRLQNGGKVSLAPTFSRRVRHAAENDKLFFVSLTVKIENTPEAPKPIDLLVTMTGIFETDAADDDTRKEAVVRATSLLYPYLRSAITNLTTTALAAPIVLPVMNGALFPEDREKADKTVS